MHIHNVWSTVYNNLARPLTVRATSVVQRAFQYTAKLEDLKAEDGRVMGSEIHPDPSTSAPSLNPLYARSHAHGF